MGIQFTREVAEWYDDYRTTFYNYQKDAEHAAEIIRELRPNARRILEVGVGTANLAIELAKLDFDVDGIDNSPFMLNIAQSKIDRERSQLGRRITLSSRRCENMNLEGDTRLHPPYDVVVSHGLFMFIGQRAGLAYASYIMKRGGNREAFDRIHGYTAEDRKKGKGGLLLINTIRDYQPERRERSPVEIPGGGQWNVSIDLRPYDNQGRGKLWTHYTHENPGKKSKTYSFEKSVFRKEEIDADLRSAGFEFVDDRFDRTGNRGFYVWQRKVETV